LEDLEMTGSAGRSVAQRSRAAAKGWRSRKAMKRAAKAFDAADVKIAEKRLGEPLKEVWPPNGLYWREVDFSGWSADF
jgi:hypothetical protein